MARGKRYLSLLFLTAAYDAFSVFLAFVAAYWFRFSGLFLSIDDIPPFHHYLRIMFFAIPVFLLTFRTYRLYKGAFPHKGIDEMFTVVKAATISILILMAATFVYREFSYSRLVMVFAWMFFLIFNIVGRLVLYALEASVRIKRGEEINLLVLGVNKNARSLLKWIEKHPRCGYKVVGVLSGLSETSGKHLNDAPILGTIYEFDKILKKHKVDEAILTIPSLSRDEIANIMLQCESGMVSFKVVADFYGMVTSSVDIHYLSGIPFLGLKSLPLDDAWNRFLKRAFDFLSSFAALIVLSPLMVVIAAIIKAVDAGPILYKQERVGQDGKVFNILKFRTMVVGAERATGPVWARENDERCTKWGSFLRKTNLDELPQLINVIRGDMSLVGPRPERPHFVEEFKSAIPRYMARHKIKSGITGWAQVNGYRGDTSLTERIKYDLYYMENWTLKFDIEILFKTLFAFKNAY